MKRVIILFLFMVPIFVICAQEQENNEKKEKEAVSKLVKAFGNFKLSGYIQTQLEVGQRDADLFVGSDRADTEDWFTRIGIRRGRLKITYADKLSTAVLHFDATEKGVSVLDMYYQVTEPWLQCFSLKAGLFYRPFGSEIFYSSKDRISPERSILFNHLFPGMRDIGASAVFQGPKSTYWNKFRLETGLFAGNGIQKETDNRKDWISNVQYNDGNSLSEWKVGASLYVGGVYRGTDKRYVMRNNRFVAENAKIGSYAKRNYYGVNAAYKIKSVLGTTQLISDIVYGNQPGGSESSTSPSSSKLPSYDLYQRNFLGWVVYLVQNIGSTKHCVSLKYDIYDPNLDISGNAIGVEGSFSTAADIRQQNLGVSYIYKFNSHFLGMLYYNFAFNETSTSLEGYEKQRRADSFTFRLQYAF